MKALSVIREILFYFFNVARALLSLLNIMLGIVGMVLLGVFAVVMFQGSSGSYTGLVIFFLVIMAIILIIPMFFAIVAYAFPVLFAVLRMIIQNPKAKFAMAIVNASLLIFSSARTVLACVSGLFSGLTELIQSNSSNYYSSVNNAATLSASAITMVLLLTGIIRFILAAVLLTLTLIVDIHMLKHGNDGPEEEYEIGELDEYYSNPEPEMPDFYFGYEETTES